MSIQPLVQTIPRSLIQSLVTSVVPSEGGAFPALWGDYDGSTDAEEHDTLDSNNNTRMFTRSMGDGERVLVVRGQSSGSCYARMFKWDKTTGEKSQGTEVTLGNQSDVRDVSINGDRAIVIGDLDSGVAEQLQAVAFQITDMTIGTPGAIKGIATSAGVLAQVALKESYEGVIHYSDTAPSAHIYRAQAFWLNTSTHEIALVDLEDVEEASTSTPGTWHRYASALYLGSSSFDYILAGNVYNPGAGYDHDLLLYKVDQANNPNNDLTVGSPYPLIEGSDTLYSDENVTLMAVKDANEFVNLYSDKVNSALYIAPASVSGSAISIKDSTQVNSTAGTGRPHSTFKQGGANVLYHYESATDSYLYMAAWLSSSGKPAIAIVSTDSAGENPELEYSGDKLDDDGGGSYSAANLHIFEDAVSGRTRAGLFASRIDSGDRRIEFLPINVGA